MPAPCHTPGRGDSKPKPKPGGRVDGERSSERRARGTPSNTPYTPASVSLGRIHRKRPGDGPVDGSTSSKRRGLSATTPNPSPLASDRVGLTGPPQTPVIDLTVDYVPQANSFDSKRRVESTSGTFLGSPTRQARSALRYTSPLFPSTPTGAKRKIDFVDLTIGDDSDDDSKASSSKKPRKTVQSRPSEDIFHSPNVEKPMALGRLFDHSRQRPESKHGQAGPANLVEKKGATLLTPSQARVYPSSVSAVRPGQITNGSPRASKGMTAPMKSAFAQEGKKFPFTTESKSIETEADPHHLRRVSDSVPRAGLQDLCLAVGLSSTADKKGNEKRSVNRKTDADGPTGIDSAPDETGNLSKTDSSGPGLAAGRLPSVWQRPPLPFGRSKLLHSSASSLQGRELDASYPIRTRNGGNGSHQVVETESAGEGDRSTELGDNDLGVSAGAGQLQKPSILTIQGQAEEQSEQVADGRAGGSNEHDERGSTGPMLAIGRRNDTQDKLRPPTPLSSRRRRSRIVALRAPPDQLRRISQRPVQRPEIPMDICFLIWIPLEIQEKIFAYLLLADDPIQVLHGWAKLYQRQRSNLSPAILSTCQAIYRNASVFLYGRNVFRYMVRDRAESDAFPSFGQDINVEKYMPLFRKLELKIERSRTERAYCTSLANAIHLLNRNGANLHTLTLDVSPTVEGDTLSTVGYFYPGGEIIQALKALKTCFIVVRVYTPKTKKEPATSLRRKLDMRIDLCRFEQAPDQPPETQLDDLSEKITAACESPSKVVERGWFEEFEVVPQPYERRARPLRIAYNDEDDDDDVGGSDEDDDGDDSGDFRG
ncbi:hypothetical protein INS49_014452 [Diaporthe citri]|uniref:uncharacterized protein n=1 Tax=Diaporthe citri TaxID=83186 RepID=UPI001C80B687|nr:uncharacterized protein INS49_014452 [Diaporthe citri]KAG6356579.1 hypothetical protein INS49_014452 [Diaporthe citri]